GGHRQGDRQGHGPADPDAAGLLRLARQPAPASGRRATRRHAPAVPERRPVPSGGAARPGHGRGRAELRLSDRRERRPDQRRADGVSPAYPHACFAGDYNTLIEINPDRQALVALDVVIELDPGRTLTGTVLGPDGKPLAGAHGNRLAHHGHTGHWEQMPLETAHVTVNGVAPGKKRRLVFVHEQRTLAGTLVVSGDDADPLAVKLAPWGEVTGRVVTADGRPCAGLVLSSQIFRGDDLTRASLRSSLATKT